MVNDISTSVTGKLLGFARSSLTCFAVGFDDGAGLLIEAAGTCDQPQIKVASCSGKDLPELEEAVCTVDWSWILGSKIEHLSTSKERLQLKLNPVGPLTISLGLWQGKPFLTFMPYRCPR